MDQQQQQQSQLKQLITRGKEQGYLTYSEVNDHLPEGIVEPEQYIQIKSKACLDCHSTVDVAPKTMLDLYGSAD